MSWPPASRACAQCGRVRDSEDFSKNQWRKGIGLSRCTRCIHGKGGAKANSLDYETARRNQSTLSTWDSWDLDHPFAQGTFRWVARGKYLGGPRDGEACVMKWFKAGCVYEASFYEKDIKASEKALHIVDQWNRQRLIGQRIRLNEPEVKTMFSRCSKRNGQKVLVEPFITNWKKFNSNTGWSTSAVPWDKVMQALSHYSYHVSSGQFLLCDLQGGIYQDGAILSDPVILSREQGRYGVTDLGPEGISNFFHHHRCNEYCREEWTQPRDAARYYKAVKRTTMEHVPARYSRPALPVTGQRWAPAIQEVQDEDYDSGYYY